jgi:hypothetical protein
MALNPPLKDILAVALYITAMIGLLLLTAPPDPWLWDENTDTTGTQSLPPETQTEANEAMAD